MTLRLRVAVSVVGTVALLTALLWFGSALRGIGRSAPVLDRRRRV